MTSPHSPQTTSENLLVVDVGALTLLDDVMGKTVTDTALGELNQRLPPLFDSILAHTHSPRLLPTRRGRWCAQFGWDETPVVESRDEILGVIEMAAQQLAGDLAIEVFGGATGLKAQVTARALRRPDGVTESGLDAWLNRQLALSDHKRAELAELGRRIDTIIAQGAIRTMMQPIVSFQDGHVMGFEALSRGPAGSDLERADQLFDAAARTGRTLALERACALQAARCAQELPPPLFLNINASEPLLREEAVRTALGRPGIVVELTEHMPIDTANGLAPIWAGLKAAGTDTALDDTGCGFADFTTAEILRPGMVKLCITVIRGARRNPDIIPELRHTVDRFRALGARVLAEGVETVEERDALAGLDIALAQGWLFGKPFPAAEWRRHA